jgi:hypothetical protein
MYLEIQPSNDGISRYIISRIERTHLHQTIQNALQRSRAVALIDPSNDQNTSNSHSVFGGAFFRVIARRESD